MSINISFSDNEVIEIIKSLGNDNYLSSKILHKAYIEKPSKYRKFFDEEY